MEQWFGIACQIFVIAAFIAAYYYVTSCTKKGVTPLTENSNVSPDSDRWRTQGD